MRSRFGYGDVWTWVALDADTKLVPSWLVGRRDAGYAFQFMSDLAARFANRVQLTTDGHKSYLTAVEDVFGTEVDYSMLVKIYGTELEANEVRYSPPKCLGARKQDIIGNPDAKHVSTSYVERQARTSEFDHAHEHEAIHKIDQWFLKEDRESRLFAGPSLYPL